MKSLYFFVYAIEMKESDQPGQNDFGSKSQKALKNLQALFNVSVLAYAELSPTDRHKTDIWFILYRPYNLMGR